jgi:hypothetical protein
MSKEKREQIQNALKEVNLNEFVVECLNRINEGARDIDREIGPDKLQVVEDTIQFLKSLREMGLNVNTYLHERLLGILYAEGVVEGND